MAQRRRIGTIRVQVKRTVRVTGTVTSRTTIRPYATGSPPLSLNSLPPRQLTRRSSVQYTPPERRFLDQVKHEVDADIERDRDAFLCHAWADRDGAASELYESLRVLDVDVWFSENEVQLGRSLARQLDSGLRVSKIGVVLVTPAMLVALRAGGFADQELGALLAGGRAIPVVHETTYGQLRAESPLLASRAGLSTENSSLADIATKIAESVLRVGLG